MVISVHSLPTYPVLPFCCPFIDLFQLKIFSTAAFAVVLLGRNISATKWRALLLLVIGCILVASPTFNRAVDCAKEMKNRFLSKDNEDEQVTAIESMLGVLTVLSMVTISGYSAIYFEKMLKKVGEKITIWERNFQLALYSIVLLVAIVAYELQDDYDERIAAKEPLFFNGWTLNTVLIALVQAGGGLLVAATLKYADAVLKTLATSGIPQFP